MKILAVETSCDETAIALVSAQGGLKSPKFKIIKNLVASQIKIHQPFGGVVPNLAKREHLKNLPILFKKLQALSFKIQDLDLIAVTVGPGLEPALWTGINFAKNLYKELKSLTLHLKPKLLGVSHLDGHLYSFLLQASSFKLHDVFPAVALIISGGHTILLKMDSLTKYKKLGETLDDAVGEAFDKVARLLNLPYPGGPEIEKLAKKGNSDAINFPRPMLNQKNYNFSFSGLKTAVLYYLRDQETRFKTTNAFKSTNLQNSGFVDSDKFVVLDRSKADVAASFQKAAFDVLIKKTMRAAKEFNAKSIMISGGVAANKTLAKEFKQALKNLEPLTFNLKPELCITQFPTDNAAMIAVAAYINYLRGKKYKLKAQGNLNIK